MVVCESSINNIMGGIENTGGVTLHNHRRKLKQRFDIIKKLGQGTYGKVQLGINKETGQEVAIKTIKKCKIETEADLIRIRREIQIMSSVQHPNIIHIYEVFENREKMVLVMEYAAGGELYDYLSERKVLAEDEARRIFRQIATAVYYCHKHKICHRDLKLENILLDENGSAKIADFGLSNVFDERRLLSTFCGSPLYASPEIVKGTPYHGPEVDCWSLGVLLYTLVYGAMPFDGSNFKRLVKQISQGDYFEPKKPSSASPLIREMLTVIPEKRADIEKICAHWWVNASYTESCLDIAEDLANQTPVRLDLLLSLAPPPPPVGGDKLVIAGESSSMGSAATESSAPARSQSVGSLMELAPSAERRIRDLVSSEDIKSPKRRLEVTVSTENANLSNNGAKRKEKLPKKDQEKEAELTQPVLTKNLTQTMVKEEEKQETPGEIPGKMEEINDSDPNLQGAACSELIEESNKKNEMKEKEKKKVVKVVKKKVPTSTAAVSETKQDQNDTEASKTIDKENKSTEVDEKKEDTKIPVKRKTVKKVLTDKSQNIPTEKPKTEAKKAEEKAEDLSPNEEKNKNEEATPPLKPVVRRQSKIFETAEKFQNLLQSNDSKASVVEKPKKIFIPGVNVGGFKKEFERKASLTSSAVPDLKKVMSKKTVPPSNQTDKQKQDELPDSNSANTETENASSKEIVQNTETKQETPESVPEPQNEENGDKTLQERKKNAVDIISNAITKEGTRKSKSRPCMMRKPPVPFGINGRSASGSIGLIPSQFSPTITKSPELSSPDENSVTSSAEITLKSATLPRRKTTKAEIKLDYPPPRPVAMEFKTEMAHKIESRPELKSQRSEIIVPVVNNVNNRIRSSSLDPEIKPKSVESPKERIIPISFERDDNNEKHDLSSPQAKPPMPKPFQATRPVQPQRFGSISRQSTHDSDTETTASENMEPIRKSPREYIIPIAVEGGGYVTPRATSLEPSETASTMTSTRRSMPRFGRSSKRTGDDGSEEDISFASLHRHNSVGRDSDNEDSRREPFHMHRLRSSRPTRKANLEHADSLSSGEEDDDDGFEILTAENLFSTLLSRVRSLTQRLNVEDNGRLGFPNTRLLGNFDHGSKLWNLHNDSLSRFTPMERAFRDSSSSVGSRTGAPWRRSVSRDLATDIEHVFSDTPAPTATATLPRDKSKKSKEANLYDLDLSELKLTDEDAIALSYLTPGLSRRIQNQLLSQLPPRKDRSQTKIAAKKPKEYVFSDSSDSELLSSRNSDSLLDEYNFPRPPKHSYSSSRASEYSPIAESPILEPKHKHDTNHVESKPLNIYRLEDIKKEYNIDKTDNNKYTPFKNCFRSTSLVEQPTSSTYKNPLYFRNVNYSSESFDSKYGSEKPVSSPGSTKYNTINPRTYGLAKHQEDNEDSLSRRTPSKYGTSNYYDNCVYSKERKKRELETQKVLKEIRNKRINDHKEKYVPREHKNSVSSEPVVNHSKLIENHDPEPIKSEKSGDTSSDCSTIDKSNKSDIKEEKNIKREGKISKLIRPKSYPTECRTETKTPTNIPETKSKLKKRSPSVDKSSPAKDLQNDGKKHSNNQFLSSIEKKIRSFYSESQPNTNNEKVKNDVNSRIQSTIRSLREQSEPTNEHCVTESGLIKRAVSSEDFSVFGSNTKPIKTLQPSRKSVSKILGLFKKYEDKSTKAAKTEENGTTKKNKNSVDGINKKIKTKSDSSSSKNKRESNKTPVNTEVNNIETKTTNDVSKKSKLKALSKLPVKGLNVEPELPTERRKSIPVPEVQKSKLPVEEINHPERKDLKLNLTKKTSDFKYRDYNNDVSTDNDNSSALFSPCDESNDSWSVCSDLHRQDNISPGGDNKLFSEDEGNESVSDRIRRKSFYCRFNEKKKPRKTSLSENRFDYTKFDLKYPEVSSSHSKSSSRTSKQYDDSLPKSLSNSSYPSKNDSKLYKRTLSMNDNYYANYNPTKYRESSISPNVSNSTNDKSADCNNEKSSTMKTKRSLLKTPTKLRNRMSMSPPLQDFDNFGPSTSNHVDIPTKM